MPPKKRSKKTINKNTRPTNTNIQTVVVNTTAPAPRRRKRGPNRKGTAAPPMRELPPVVYQIPMQVTSYANMNPPPLLQPKPEATNNILEPNKIPANIFEQFEDVGKVGTSEILSSPTKAEQLREFVNPVAYTPSDFEVTMSEKYDPQTNRTPISNLSRLFEEVDKSRGYEVTMGEKFLQNLREDDKALAEQNQMFREDGESYRLRMREKRENREREDMSLEDEETSRLKMREKRENRERERNENREYGEMSREDELSAILRPRAIQTQPGLTVSRDENPVRSFAHIFDNLNDNVNAVVGSTTAKRESLPETRQPKPKKPNTGPFKPNTIGDLKVRYKALKGHAYKGRVPIKRLFQPMVENMEELVRAGLPLPPNNFGAALPTPAQSLEMQQMGKEDTSNETTTKEAQLQLVSVAPRKKKPRVRKQKPKPPRDDLIYYKRPRLTDYDFAYEQL